MTSPSFPRLAPGGPNIEPRWTRGAKVAVGTAYSTVMVRRFSSFAYRQRKRQGLFSSFETLHNNALFPNWAEPLNLDNVMSLMGIAEDNEV
jgi:hypothetical protein